MITLGSVLFLILAGVAVVLWQSSAKDRELATRASRQVCEAQHLQFLDDTAMLDSLRIHRDEKGQLGFLRRYHFEFYNGQERLKGKVTIFHHVIIELYLENPLPDIEKPKERNLFKSANETSNVIPFPKRDSKKKDD